MAPGLIHFPGKGKLITVILEPESIPLASSLRNSLETLNSSLGIILLWIEYYWCFTEFINFG